MPNPALLHAIDRLDKATARAETALEGARRQNSGGSARRNQKITEALTEIDDLLACIGKADGGKTDSGKTGHG